jgi:hypothetical protein
MRKHLRNFCAGFALLIAAGGPIAARSCEFEPGFLQIMLLPGVPIELIDAIYGTVATDSLPPFYLVQLPTGADEDAFLSWLLSDPRVQSGEKALRLESPEGSRQMTVAGVGGTIEEFQDQAFVGRIGLPQTLLHTRGDGVRIAVLDTGIRADHPAIAGAIDPGGYDFVSDDPEPQDAADGIDGDLDGATDEGAGHGTMIAGIAHLIAPGATLLPIRVLDDEARGTSFNVAKAIRYAVDHGAHIVNLSLGLECESKIIAHEIGLADSLGVTVVAAAGNQDQEEPPYYPAWNPLVLSVAAVDSADVKAPFSNYHASVDLSAPGIGILAPYYDGEYALGAGTSFAAPMVAGQTALIRALNPSLVKAEVDSLARLGVAPLDSIPGNESYAGKLGSGRVDVWQTWLVTPAGAGIEDPPDFPPTRIAVFPNPSAAGEALTICLGTRSTLSLYDVRGRRIRTLRSSGPAVLTWDGRDEAGRPVAPGVYFLGEPGHIRLVRTAR